MAAYVGDDGARLALASEAPRLELELVRWLAGLDDAEAAARAVVSVARLMISTWEAVFPQVSVVREAVEAAQGYLDSATGEGAQELSACAGASAAAGQLVRRLTASMRDAAEAGCSPLDARERAIAWLDEHGVPPVLVSLGLSAPQAVDLLRRECAGPQGEASVHGVIGFAFQRPLDACSVAVGACAEAQRLGAARVSPELASESSLTAHQNAGAYARQVSRVLGTGVVRGAIREALSAWALRETRQEGRASQRPG